MSDRTSDCIAYELTGPVARITMDDGKANVLSLEMLHHIRAGFDRAEADGAVVVLGGRPGIFSGGFDLSTLRAGGQDALDMLAAGFELAEHVLAFPYPVIVACPGHAIAMGLFLLLSGDYRIGVAGPYRLTANEVAIGLTMPMPAIEILRQRLTPAAFNRAVVLAEPFSPEDAVPAGILDRVVAPDELDAAAEGLATTVAGLDMAAHGGSKRRARAETLTRLRAAIESDQAELRALFLPGSPDER